MNLSIFCINILILNFSFFVLNRKFCNSARIINTWVLKKLWMTSIIKLNTTWNSTKQSAPKRRLRTATSKFSTKVSNSYLYCNFFLSMSEKLVIMSILSVLYKWLMGLKCRPKCVLKDPLCWHSNEYFIQKKKKMLKCLIIFPLSLMNEGNTFYKK